MNNDFTLSVNISGATLDKIFGRRLTDREIEELTSDNTSGYLMGCDGMPSLIVRTLEDVCERLANDDDYEEEMKASNVEPLCVPLADDCYWMEDWDGDEPMVIAPMSNISDCPSQKKIKANEDFRKLSMKMREGERKEWKSMPIEKVLDMLKEKELEGHTYRTLKGWEGYEDYVRHHLHLEDGVSYRMPTDFNQIDYDAEKDFGDGRMRQIAYIKPRWVINDDSVLYDIYRSFNIKSPDAERACIGRGSNARNVLEAIVKTLTLLQQEALPLNALNTIAQFAGMMCKDKEYCDCSKCVVAC